MNCKHFIHCILEGLRRTKIKPLNYSQVMAVQQGPLKALGAFLQKLKDALQIIPTLYQSHRRRVLKDKYLT
jgi:hypothetical protein